jgi:hypothetical protein
LGKDGKPVAAPEEGGPGGLVLRLEAEGVRGRFQKGRVKVTYTLRLQLHGDACSGAYAGTATGEPAIQNGPRSGAASPQLKTKKKTKKNPSAAAGRNQRNR